MANFNPDGGGASTSTQASAITNAANAAALSARKQNKPLHPEMLPPAFAVNGVYKTGRMYSLPYVTDNVSQVDNGAAAAVSKYAFNFLYNPSDVTLNTQVDWSMNYNANDTYSKIPNQQFCQFQLLLNRIADVKDPRPEFQVATGTLHDTEYLYRCINGDPRFVPGVGMTSDVGFLTPTRLQVVFGPKFTFVGFITGLAIQHTKFAQSMIPVLSTVQISMQRALPSPTGT